MKKFILFVMLLAIAVLTPACGRQENAAGGNDAQTATFAPPEPQPGELGTDAMTQTVELSDGRSENEGGVITTPDPSVRVGGSPVPPVPTATSTTTTTTGTANPPPPRKQ
ncbi:MAG TPA: hypothetical protein VFT12_06625 [Thermoanaerobaculia bacterium]|nr:hypothetical protein [Thermoanaerobaculia bacterium]